MALSQDDVLAARTRGLMKDKLEAIEQNVLNAALAKLNQGHLTPDHALQALMEINAGRRLDRALAAAERRVNSAKEQE